MNAYELLCQKLNSMPESLLLKVLSYVESILAEPATKNEPHITEEQDTPNSKGIIFPITPCPHCHGEQVIRHGFKCGKQRFLCKGCGKTFVSTTGTLMENSHFGDEVWKEVIADTMAGNISIDKTAARLGISHSTIFYMRHKILMAMAESDKNNPTVLKDISELDETYVLECLKGKKFDSDSQRKPRKHGGKASKCGVSNEQVCIMAGVQRNGGPAYATTLNRAHPSTQEIEEAFSGHIGDGSVIFTDGLKGYNRLESVADCIVESVTVGEQKQTRTANLNTVNGFHSCIKSLYVHYKGVATKYINRYNALFSRIFRSSKCENTKTDIMRGHVFTYKDVAEEGLILI